MVRLTKRGSASDPAMAGWRWALPLLWGVEQTLQRALRLFH
jgi:hypothetical protein